MKKKANRRKKLSLRPETLAALQDRGLENAQGGAHFSIPPFYTCPECAPP